jgi:hypothetical protein
MSAIADPLSASVEPVQRADRLWRLVGRFGTL